MFKINEYAYAFKKGMNYVLYGSEGQTRKFPTLDASSMESMGYYDGYQYGEFLELTCQTMSISDEQLLAVIDKNHTQALKRYYEYCYVFYKSGFFEGKINILEKIMGGDIDFEPLSEIIGNDWNSIGYFDGYNYFLSEYFKNNGVTLDNSKLVDEIAHSFFQERMNISKEKVKEQR